MKYLCVVCTWAFFAFFSMGGLIVDADNSYALGSAEKYDSVVSSVRNGMLHFDKSITLGEALEGYQFIKNPTWKSFKDKQNRQYVAFIAEIDMSQSSEYQNCLKSIGIPINLLIEFVINRDNTFEPHYLEYYSPLIHQNIEGYSNHSLYKANTEQLLWTELNKIYQNSFSNYFCTNVSSSFNILFRESIQKRNKYMIEAFLNAGIKPDFYSLYHAIKTKDKKIVQMITNVGVEINSNSILTDAIETKDKEIVQMIIDTGVEANSSSLNEAIKTKEKEIVQLVINAGAKIHRNHLNEAIKFKNKDIIQLVIEKGPKPESFALGSAIQTKDKEIIQMLINAGAEINSSHLSHAINLKNKDIIQLLIEKGPKPESFVLNSAIETKDKEIIQMIINAGAEINSNDLGYAIYLKSKDIIQFLIEKGAKPDSYALSSAIKTKDKEIVQMIINTGVKPNMYDLFQARHVSGEMVKIVEDAMN